MNVLDLEKLKKDVVLREELRTMNQKKFIGKIAI